jgi:lysophospholipase L1-like esterase
MLGSIMLACGLFLPAGCGTPGRVGTAYRPGGIVNAGETIPATSARAQMLAAREELGECEQRLERGPRGGPRLAIVGASFTAGVGPGVPAQSWAAVLAQALRWNAVIYGVPGAGYASAGEYGLGPVVHLLTAERLRRLAPSLVIVQAGHDDGGLPLPLVRRQVTQAVDEIGAQAPGARIALLTTFTRPSTARWRLYYRTDLAIVTAARAADPKVIIMDPLTGRWRFAHVNGKDLHPTAAGNAEIARHVEAILRTHGIASTSTAATVPAVCQVTIGARLVHSSA